MCIQFAQAKETKVPSFDARVVASIATRAQDSLPRFLDAWQHRTQNQTGFIVTAGVIHRCRSRVAAIAVDRINEGMIIGRLSTSDFEVVSESNQLVACPLANVLSWRYVEAGVLHGGFLFHEQFSQLSAQEARELLEVLPFVVSFNEQDDIARLRHAIANNHLEDVKGFAESAPRLFVDRQRFPRPSCNGDERYHFADAYAVEFAVSVADERTIDYFLTHYWDIETVSIDWLLFVASHSGCVPGITACVQHGADVNSRPAFGLTPLHKATLENRVRAIEALLAEGADADITTPSGQTAMQLAYSFETRNLLAAHNAGRTQAQVESGNEEALQPRRRLWWWQFGPIQPANWVSEIRERYHAEVDSEARSIPPG